MKMEHSRETKRENTKTLKLETSTSQSLEAQLEHDIFTEPRYITLVEKLKKEILSPNDLKTRHERLTNSKETSGKNKTRFLSSYIKFIKQTGQFICRECGYKASDKPRMLVHYRSHSGERPYQCEICESRFKQLGHLQTHSLIHTGEKSFTCKFCKMCFGRKSNLTSHIKKVHELVKVCSCSTCGKKFSSRTNLNIHFRIHTGERPYGCDLCGAKFTQSTNLTKHKQSHLRKSLKNKARLSNMSKVESRNSLNRNIDKRSETVEMEIVPDNQINSKIRISGQGTKVNRKKNTLLKKSKTPEMDKDIKTDKSNPLVHVLKERKVGQSSKEKKCDHCQKTFQGKSQLRMHILTHTGQKPFRCEICDKYFRQKAHLMAHKRFHSGEKKIACHFCTKLFREKSSLTNHVKVVHLGQRPFQCVTCEKKFPSRSHLKIHLRTHTGEKPYECDKCGKWFVQSSVLARHKRSHLRKSYMCDSLEMYVDKAVQSSIPNERKKLNSNGMGIYSSEQAVEKQVEENNNLLDEGPKANLIENILLSEYRQCEKEHSHLAGYSNKSIGEIDKSLNVNQRNTNKAILKCDQCQKEFPGASQLRKHMITHIGERNFGCDVCNAKFKQKAHLLDHKDSHSAIKPFQCSLCEKKFKRKQTVTRHVINFHLQQRRYKCSTCGKQLVSRRSLTDHTRTHTGEKPFGCEHCDARFSRLSSLRYHQVQHSETGKPLICDVCSARFIRTYDLENHYRSHTGEKPHQCDYCGIRFSSLQILRSHKRKHSSEKKYVCSICGAQFTYASNLIQHMKTHSEDKPFQCHLCDKKFKDKGTLKRHGKTHTLENIV